MSWIDSHVHLDAPEFEGKALELVSKARALDVKYFVSPAVRVSDFAALKTLAHDLPGVGYTLGIHPLYVDQHGEDALLTLREQVEAALPDPRFLGLGETGLDFFVPGLDKEKQLQFFRKHLRLAKEFQLPVIMHVRRSVDLIHRECRAAGISQGIAHAFNGSLQQAEALIRLGLCLGFGGAMTYSRASQIQRLAKSLPLECLVLETDAPDIPPAWLHDQDEGLHHNSPAQLARIGNCLAGLRGLSVEELAQKICANTFRSVPRLRTLCADPAFDSSFR
jgi:TatD DNase family protein